MRAHAEAPQAEAQLLKSFLTNMATIIGRDPSIFFEALLATCCVTRTANRPIIQLKPTAKVRTLATFSDLLGGGVLQANLS